MLQKVVQGPGLLPSCSSAFPGMLPLSLWSRMVPHHIPAAVVGKAGRGGRAGFLLKLSWKLHPSQLFPFQVSELGHVSTPAVCTGKCSLELGRLWQGVSCKKVEVETIGYKGIVMGSRGVRLTCPGICSKFP